MKKKLAVIMAIAFLVVTFSSILLISKKKNTLKNEEITENKLAPKGL